MGGYDSPTGLYSIRYGPELIHEGISHVEASELMDYYRVRYDKMKGDYGAWTMDPDKMKVEPFSGTRKLSPKR